MGSFSSAIEAAACPPSLVSRACLMFESGCVRPKIKTNLFSP